ncbi:LPXTG cell wall anchor domain-containing protein [Streptomyces sp. NPDC088729]|uniref:LPXTG cell wall anchor domain-containing protein n=1 Tax=Streptomyces sp. NPDC088729 TaxID=3365876 RepID=UPI003814616E
MKLHRALAIAAVTAFIGPAALLAAPAAHATGEAALDRSPTASASPAPAAGSSAADTAQKKDATPTPSYTRPTFCSGIPDEERGKTSLHGLPSELVAGSGWHDFTYRVTNVSQVKVMETDASLYLGTADPDLDDIAELAVTVEWFNTATNTWKPIEGEGADVFDNQEFVTLAALAPGEHTDARMRVKVAATATPGTGYFFTTGHSYGEDGQCGFDEISQFDFTVLAPGSKPGPAGEAEGKPGSAEEVEAVKDREAREKSAGTNDPAPQSGSDAPRTANVLAETGSPAALPTLVAIGGVALAAGAFLVARRRKADPAA